MFRIELYENIMHTPALGLAVRCWHELLEEGWCNEGAQAVAWDQKAFVAFTSGDSPIGVLTWIDQAWCNQLSVGLAYVLPKYRRQGVHTLMWNSLVGKARELKRPVILSNTHLHNATSRAMMKKQGRIESGVLTKYYVTLIE